MLSEKKIKSWFRAVEKGHFGTIQSLRKDIDNIDVQGNFHLNNVKHEHVTGLMIASHLGNKDVVRWFLRNKADTNIETHLGWRSVHFAAKQGHLTTIDMLVANGASVDSVTSNNETPLSLAIQARMRDTVRKLIKLGAGVGQFSEDQLCQYMHRRMPPAELFPNLRSAKAPGSPTDKLKYAVKRDKEGTNRPYHPQPIQNHFVEENLPESDYTVTVVNSQVLANQLQFQSTNYDLELARRKRELIHRLPSLPGLSSKSANLIMEQMQCISRPDLSEEVRKNAVNKLIQALPDRNTFMTNGVRGDEDQAKPESFHSSVEPYLRLVEACVCESHCPNDLAVHLSQLCVRFVVLSNRAPKSGKSQVGEKSSATPSPIITYILKLCRKLIYKNNAQCRCGIVFHLSRLLSDPKICHVSEEAGGVTCWNHLRVDASFLNSLVGLCEYLEHPSTVMRCVQLIGLSAYRLHVSLSTDSIDDDEEFQSIATRFSDLADILVGWIVDPNSLATGVSPDVIHDMFAFNLSYWWLHPPPSSNTDSLPTLLPSLRNMMCHLLEDLQNGRNTLATIEWPVKGGQENSAADPMVSLISMRLFVSVLSSIAYGIASRLASHPRLSFISTVQLTLPEAQQWVDSMLQLINIGSNNGYQVSHTRRPHGAGQHSAYFTLTPPISLQNALECGAYVTLDCLLQASDCSDLLLIPVWNFLRQRQQQYQTTTPILSTATLKSILLLNHHLFTRLDNAQSIVEQLLLFYGPRSRLHAYKIRLSPLHNKQPHAHLMLKALCDMASLPYFKNGLLQLIMVDLKYAVQYIKSKPAKLDLATSVCESLILFNLTLFSHLLKLSSTADEACDTRRQLYEVLEQEYLSVWSDIPIRSRCGLLAILQNLEFVNTLNSSDLVYLSTSFMSVTLSSPIESRLINNWLLMIFSSSPRLSVNDKEEILFNFCILIFKQLYSDTVIEDVLAVFFKTLIIHSLKNAQSATHRLHSSLLRLTRCALTHPEPVVNKCGSDLLILMELSSHAHVSPFAPIGPTLLCWFGNQRLAQYSVTSLARSKLSTEHPPSLTSLSGAYPSLPAVAGVLGLLTRGAPYDRTNVTKSRLKLLHHPTDWLQRLAHIISPVPTDSFTGHGWWNVTNSATCVLWFAARSMVDYKLKVAPWVNPLKTFLALEGALRGFLQPLLKVSNPESGSVLINHFHLTSSHALQRQSWTRQIQQSKLLVLFLGYLERLVANATHGFALTLPRPISPVCTFFGTNEATCIQWFSRVRLMLIRLVSEWPVICRPGVGGSDMDSAASVIYYAYYCLLNLPSSTIEAGERIYRELGGMVEEVLIYAGCGLFNLSAWEELEALFEWVTEHKIFEDHNPHPFGWLKPLSTLSRGQWDVGVDSLYEFLTRWLKSRECADDDTVHTKQIEMGIAYALCVLLQAYIDMGDYETALDLRRWIRSIHSAQFLAGSTETSEELVPLHSKLTMLWNRLDCFAKLSNWSVPSVMCNKKCISDWNSLSMSKHGLSLDCSLTDIAVKFRQKSTTQDNKLCSKFVDHIRQASAATLAICSPIPAVWCKPGPSIQFGLCDGMSSWLQRLDLTLGKSIQAFDDTNLILDHLDPVCLSSWLHLMDNTDSSSNVRTVSSLQACRWACTQNSPNLCQRLLNRVACSLNLIQSDDRLHNVNVLYDLVNTLNFAETNRLSQIQRLQFTDCVAQVLWRSQDSDSEFNKRLMAIDALSRGLRNVLLEEVNQDHLLHVARCQSSAKVALRLFDWLQEPAGGGSGKLVDLVSQYSTIKDDTSNKLFKTATIVQNLNFFSRLVDEPWANGLPLVPSSNLLPTATSSNHANPMAWSNRLLMMATRLSPTGSSTEAWLRMADWCFSRGQSLIRDVQSTVQTLLIPSSTNSKPVDTSPNPSTGFALHDLLQPDERESLISILNTCNNSNIESTSSSDDQVPHLLAALLNFLVQHVNGPHDRTQSDDSLLDSQPYVPVPNMHNSAVCPDDNFDDYKLSEPLQIHLRTVLPTIFPSSVILEPETLHALHQLLIVLIQRQYSMHTSAAQAYATFLTVAGQFGPDVATNKLSTKTHSSLYTTTATLKLLDLLSAPCRSLRSLIAGFLMHGAPTAPPMSFTPSLTNTTMDHRPRSGEARSSIDCLGSGTTLGGPAIWEACLPQVLVRLNFPDPAVKECLVSLLTRLVLTGTQTSSTSTIASQIEGDCSVKSIRLAPSYRFAAHLVYPAVVAALDVDNCRIQRNTSSRVSIPDYNLAQRSRQGFSNDSCFLPILTALQSAGFAELVRQVNEFVLELQRITLLWDELWLGVLQQHLEEFGKKLNFLETELNRSKQFAQTHRLTSTTDGIGANKENCDSAAAAVRDDGGSCGDDDDDFDNGTGDKALRDAPGSTSRLKQIYALKYLAIVQPTLNIISQLCAITFDVQPETLHEEWFQRTFASAVKVLRSALSEPIDLTDTKIPMVLMRQLIWQLQTAYPHAHRSKLGPPPAATTVATRLHRPSGGSMTNLILSHISPRLAQMHFGKQSIPGARGIPLPGRLDVESARLSNCVTVLPTKTKPKRLTFRSRDGYTYPYLLKGLEDLRLDDRIMRLFELANGIMTADSKTTSDYPPLCARTYAVTPLGVRAGLLQMVQGAAPLFSLYKGWQLREHRTNELFNNSPSPSAVVPKPGELFHSRLKDLLTANGLTYQPQGRTTWPTDVLEQVLTSLELETPANLLSRELWAVNSSTSQWWHTFRTYARSVSLMSSLGYLVGLGDRHLDNLLIDLTTGHLIHIDYNVCFDKGRTLRVTERVPFRLTQNLRHALGPLARDKQVRGTFRTTSEQTLECLRRFTEPLLIQMKAFLIDPLIDWSHKSPTSTTIPDYSHFGAYLGGGTSHTHQLASVVRRKSRIQAENRVYVGLLLAHLWELKHSKLVNTIHDALDQIISNLCVWKQWDLEQVGCTRIQHHQQAMLNASDGALCSAENQARSCEASEQTLFRLQHEFTQICDEWNSVILTYRDKFAKLSDTSWMANLIATHIEQFPQLCSAVADYYHIARVYLTYPTLLPTHSGWIDPISHILEQLKTISNNPPDSILTNSDIDHCLSVLSTHGSSVSNISVDPELLAQLKDAIVENQQLITDLRNNTTEPLLVDIQSFDLQTMVHSELDNLHLFVNDQGFVGMTMYSWALLEYLTTVVPNLIGLETDPTFWQAPNRDAVATFHPLDQCTMQLETLAVLFSVFHHQPTETLYLSAGLEADARRELAFLWAVRDACLCLYRLQSNLTRLLLPALLDALMESNGNLADEFVNLLVEYQENQHTVSGSRTSLPEMVDCLLCETPTKPTSDDRLRQVLFAAHLALTNCAAQMDEIAQRVREYPVTAAAWYYVDILAHSAATMLTRCTWREGATSLWGWASSTPGTGNRSDPVCSWTEEIYLSGLLAFVSVVEDGRNHWHSLGSATSTSRTDVVLKPFVYSIDRFFGRLISRLGLVSLVTLSFGRLICTLIGNAGISICDLVVENKIQAKAAGLLNPVINLQSERLVEITSSNLCLTLGAHQHLRGPVSILLYHLTSRTEQLLERIRLVCNMELADKHQSHLLNTLAILKWTHKLPSDTHDPVEYVSLLDVVRRMEQALRDDGTMEAAISSSSTSTTSKSKLHEVANVIVMLENIRLYGPSYCESYTDCNQLLHQLKEAMRVKQMADNALSELGQILLKLKSKYNLEWPANLWLSTPCVTTSEHCATVCTLKEQLSLDVSSSKLQLASVLKTLQQVRQHFQHSIHGRQSHKRSSREPASHGHHHPTDQPVVVTQLRTTLASLQSDHLSEIRHMIKLLSRYEQAYWQLDNELADQPLSQQQPQQSKNWSDWLSAHHSWVTCLSTFVKQLTLFINQIDPSLSSVKHTCQDQTLRVETQTANDLLNECIQIQSGFWRNLLQPILMRCHEVAQSDVAFSAMTKSHLEILGLEFSQIFTPLRHESSSSGEVGSNICSQYNLQQENDFFLVKNKPINSMALGVWSRFRDRLMGCDPLLHCPTNVPPHGHEVENKYLTVAEQVDACIRSAVDTYNLALMYEGWMAWV